MSKTSQALIHALLEPVKKLKFALSKRISQVEEEIVQFNDRFMQGRN